MLTFKPAITSVQPGLILLLLLVSVGLSQHAHAQDEPPRTSADQIKGDWVQYRNTPEGRYMTIKQHFGQRTVLTTYDPQRLAIYSHQSDYVVDESGPVPIFRYKNKVVLVGPNVGFKDERENAYLFRVRGDKFIEVQGMLPGDNRKPRMTVWERLKVNPIPKPATHVDNATLISQ